MSVTQAAPEQGNAGPFSSAAADLNEFVSRLLNNRPRDGGEQLSFHPHHGRISGNIFQSQPLRLAVDGIIRATFTRTPPTNWNETFRTANLNITRPGHMICHVSDSKAQRAESGWLDRRPKSIFGWPAGGTAPPPPRRLL